MDIGMDSLTHCVAGSLTPFLFAKAPKRAALILFGAFAGQLPDIDAFFSSGTPEGLMAIHRGVTHAIVWQPFLMLAYVVPWYIFFCCQKEQTPPPLSNAAQSPSSFRPSLWLLCGIALFAQYIHLFLDSVTTFGTQIFLPLSSYRVALPGMFIVDFFLLIPLLLLVIFAWRKSPSFSSPWSSKTRTLAHIGLAWLILYPLGNLGINHALTLAYAKEYAVSPRQVTVFTEPFSPFVWKKVVWQGDTCLMETVYPLQDMVRGEFNGERFTRLSLIGTERVLTMARMQGERPVQGNPRLASVDGGLYITKLGTKLAPLDKDSIVTASGDLPTQDTFSARALVPAQPLTASSKLSSLKEAFLYEVPDRKLLRFLSKEIPLFSLFCEFAPTLVLTDVEHDVVNDHLGLVTYSFADVRYLVSPQSPARFFGVTTTSFAFEVQMSHGRVYAYRYLDHLEDTFTPWIRL